MAGLGLIGLALLAPLFPARAQNGTWALAERIAALGPRTSGSEANRQARHVLLEAMAASGLEDVVAMRGASEPDAVNLSGLVPGSGGSEILLTAHYDTVAGSPGALDDAAGCAAAIRAAEQLIGAGLRASIRVVLFDGEEAGLLGSRSFVGTLQQRPPVAAVVNLDLIGRRGVRRAVAHVAPPAGDAALAPPGWLLQAAFAAARQSRFPLEAGDARLPVPGQLVERYGRLAYSSDADPFLAAGLPALLLSDATLTEFGPEAHSPADTAERIHAERLEDWSQFAAAVVREIDRRAPAVADPRAERDYLVLFGILTSPRALWIAGGLLWMALGWRLLRLPRADRQPERLVFLLLAALAWALEPLGSALLLTPALLIGIVAPRPVGRGIPGLLGGLLPALVLLGLGGWALAAGRLSGFRPEAWRLLVPLAAVAVYGAWRFHPRMGSSRRPAAIVAGGTFEGRGEDLSVPATQRDASRETP